MGNVHNKFGLLSVPYSFEQNGLAIMRLTYRLSPNFSEVLLPLPIRCILAQEIDKSSFSVCSLTALLRKKLLFDP